MTSDKEEIAKLIVEKFPNSLFVLCIATEDEDGLNKEIISNANKKVVLSMLYSFTDDMLNAFQLHDN